MLLLVVVGGFDVLAVPGGIRLAALVLILAVPGGAAGSVGRYSSACTPPPAVGGQGLLLGRAHLQRARPRPAGEDKAAVLTVCVPHSDL